MPKLKFLHYFYLILFVVFLIIVAIFVIEMARIKVEIKSASLIIENDFKVALNQEKEILTKKLSEKYNNSKPSLENTYKELEIEKKRMEELTEKAKIIQQKKAN
ncbi:MAG: hypothetical protein PHO70_00940 [Candidatus Omnitrophica bacterium]|nr:hypothetical protein [Candidatus Omnitrophota bacterium]